jgi:hypothetical protein
MDLGQTSIYYSDYIDITKAYALFDEGVRRLGKGDKRVFTYDEANGFFARAGLITEHYGEAKWKLDYGEIVWNPNTPLMKEFFDAMVEMDRARAECGRILEPRMLAEPPRFSYNLWHAVSLPRLSCPDPLPEVPEPQNVLAKTGEEVPCSGAWEPVKDGKPSGVMNYLHGGTLAPKAKLTYKDSSDRELGHSVKITEVTWRLIWRDNRYEDGTIPAEEQDYRFDLPTTDEESPFNIDPYVYLTRHSLPHPFLDYEDLKHPRVEGGQPCPREGWWWSPADNEQKSRFFKFGEIVPIITSSSWGQSYWLWQGDKLEKDRK